MVFTAKYDRSFDLQNKMFGVDALALKAFRKQVSLKACMLAFLITALVLALGVMYARQGIQQRREKKFTRFAEWYQYNRPIANIPTNFGDLFPNSRVKNGVAIMPLADADAVLELLGTDTLAFRTRGKQCLHYEIGVILITAKGHQLIHTEEFDFCHGSQDDYSSRSEGLFIVNKPPGIGGRPKALLASNEGEISVKWRYFNRNLQFAADLTPHLPEWVLKDPLTTTATIHNVGLLIDGTLPNEVQVITSWEYRHPVHEGIRIQLTGALAKP